MAYEEPRYDVVRSTADYEIRRYEPYIVAETNVSGEFGGAGSEAFGILAGYIFGKNRRPSVTLSASNAPTDSVKMEMTVPVFSTAAQPESSDEFTYGFVMPSEFSIDSLPVPLDPRVRIRVVPERLVAVRRYSGRWSERAYREHEVVLLRSLDRDGMETEGAPLFARYNAPWTLWFLRRNEVMIGVSGEGT